MGKVLEKKHNHNARFLCHFAFNVQLKADDSMNWIYIKVFVAMMPSKYQKLKQTASVQP